MTIDELQIFSLIWGYTALYIGLNRLTASIGHPILNPKRKYGRFLMIFSGLFISIGGLYLFGKGIFENNIEFIVLGLIFSIGLGYIGQSIGLMEYDGIKFRYFLPVREDNKTKFKWIKVEQKGTALVGGIIFILFGLILLSVFVILSI